MQERYPLIVSLIFHVIILAVLIISFEWSAPVPVLENNNSKVLNAVVLDASKIQTPDPAPLPPKPKSEPPKPQPVKKILPPPPVVKPEPPVKKQVKPEPKTQPDAIAIPDKRKKIQKDLIQKQLLAELNQAKQQKKHKELAKAFEKELKAQAAKSLEQQLLNEQNRLASSAQAQKMSGVVDKYKALILQSIAQHWLLPSGVNKKLSAQLLIRVAPGGMVLDVQLVKSSGDEALDRSARTAVFKASPLPVPTDADEFNPFREFILKVKPENVIARDNDLNLSTQN